MMKLKPKYWGGYTVESRLEIAKKTLKIFPQDRHLIKCLKIAILMVGRDSCWRMGY